MRIIFFFLIGSFFSCQNNRKIELYNTFKDNVWHTDSTVYFEIDNLDTTITNDVYLMVRHTTEFKFQNLFLFTSFENQKDTLEVFLSEKNGKWLGKGFGDIKEIKTKIAENKKFKNQEKQVFSIEQAMRYEDLEKIVNLSEISAIGIAIYKSE